MFMRGVSSRRWIRETRQRRGPLNHHQTSPTSRQSCGHMWSLLLKQLQGWASGRHSIYFQILLPRNFNTVGNTCNLKLLTTSKLTVFNQTSNCRPPGQVCVGFHQWYLLNQSCITRSGLSMFKIIKEFNLTRSVHHVQENTPLTLPGLCSLSNVSRLTLPWPYLPRRWTCKVRLQELSRLPIDIQSTRPGSVTSLTCRYHPCKSVRMLGKGKKYISPDFSLGVCPQKWCQNPALLKASVTNEFHLCVCVKMGLFQQNGLGNILRPLPRKWTKTLISVRNGLACPGNI